jgi:hypothetical protein
MKKSPRFWGYCEAIMSKPSSTLIDRCTPTQLKALLTLAAGAVGEGRSLPAQVARIQEVRQLLTELCKDEPNSGAVLLATAAAPETPVETLRGIKEYAKQLLGRAQTESHRNAATLLYHVAVAAAFARHGVNISTRSTSARWPLYEDLATALAGDPLGEVFRRAADGAARLMDAMP